MQLRLTYPLFALFLISGIFAGMTIGCSRGRDQNRALHEITNNHQDPRRYMDILIVDKVSSCKATQSSIPGNKSCDEVIGTILFQWGGFNQAAVFIKTPPIAQISEGIDNLRLRLALLGYLPNEGAASQYPIIIKIGRHETLQPLEVSKSYRPDSFDTITCLAIANLRSGNSFNAELIRDTAAKVLLTLCQYSDWTACENDASNLRADYLIDFSVILEAAEKAGVQSPILGVGHITSVQLRDLLNSKSNLPPQLHAYAESMRNELQRSAKPTGSGR